MTLELLFDGQPITAELAVSEWQALELACLPPSGAQLQLWLNEQQLEPFLRPGDPAWRWRWVAQGATGVFRLLLRADWPDGTSREASYLLRVLPRKIDLDAYAALLDDLQRLSRALVFAFSGGAEHADWVDPADGPVQLLEEAALLTGPSFAEFAAAAERLVRRSPDRLRIQRTQVDPGQARQFNALDQARFEQAEDLSDERNPAELARRIQSLPELSSRPTHDSYENRLLKALLNLLWRKVEQIRQEQLPQATIDQLQQSRTRLRGLRKASLFHDVGALRSFAGPTPRLQREPDYRRVYHMWQMLRRRPLLSWADDTPSIAIQDLARLYERWSVLRVAHSLLALPGASFAEQGLAEFGAEAEWVFSIREQVPLLRLAYGESSITLRYQARYLPIRPNTSHALHSLDAHTRIPDIVLEISRADQPLRLLVLDAKYRLDAQGGVPEDALADAYSYLGSIGTREGNRAVQAVALLYPGRGQAAIYPSQVAALPLLPGNNDALDRWLKQNL